MSAPAPVPSKAAIHALRGLLFGTSCSLVLLAEERRQRINIARAAVENGRKLKSLKRYSTNGPAAIEALQEKVRTDPDFVGRSPRSRSNSSLDVDSFVKDLGPDPRRPTRPTKDTKKREKIGSSATVSSSSTDDTTPPPPCERIASDSAKETSNDPSWSRLLMSSAAMRSLPGISEVARSLTRHKTSKENAIASIMDLFWREHPHLRREEDIYHSSLPEPGLYSPENAASLVRRAYNSTASARELPAWFINFTASLCVACQQQGHYSAAAEILAMVVGHGPVSLSDYYAHHPHELIVSLMSKEYANKPKHQVLSAQSEYIDQLMRLFLADIIDIAHAVPKVLAAYLELGKKIIMKALKLHRGNQIMRVFGRVKYLTKAPMSETVWFIGQLIEHNEHSLAIDTFVKFYADLETDVDTKALCGNMVDCIIKSKGYAALEALDAVNQIRKRDGWNVEGSWIELVLWSHLKSLQNYRATQKLIKQVQDNDFYGISETYGIQRTIVRICLQGHDWHSAHSNFDRLCAQYPGARTDIELRGAFAQVKADIGNWDGVRTDLEAVKAMRPFPEDQKESFNTIFMNILQTYSKTHTWGETETFLEAYVQKLEVALDRILVRFIADRHGRCRDIKAMARWLEFCRTAGYHTDHLFWFTLFQSCRRDWKYSEGDMKELHRELTKVYIDSEELVVLTKVLEKSGHVPWEQQLNRVRLNAHRFSPADERKTFERMRLEAQHQKWAVVQSIYNRAVHNGMGHSSRCLRLGVQASVKLHGAHCEKASNMLAKAQSEGHDISNAVVPVILARFDEIERWHQSDARTVEGRGWPFRAIKGILLSLKHKDIHIADIVYDRAARVCLTLRNYREAIALCAIAAEANGRGDPCYNISNFRNLVHAYTVRHDYEKLRWVISQLKNHQYRFERACRQSLNWVIRYLRVASETQKAQELVSSDVEALEFVKQMRDIIGKEHFAVKADAQEEMLDAVTGCKRDTSDKNKAASERGSAYVKRAAFQRKAAAAAVLKAEEDYEDDHGSSTQSQEMGLHGAETAQSASDAYY